jgi:hypothetical protein
MGKSLSDKERVAYIRRGNELFNQGKYKEAETIFMLTNYRDGILRIANRYYYELRKPLVALKYYYKINARDKIEEIKERMLFAFKRLVREEDKQKEDKSSSTETDEDGKTFDEKTDKTDDENINPNDEKEDVGNGGIYPDDISS